MLQWSARQIHDTVAAIARQPVYGGASKRSLLGRALRFVFDRIADLFRGVEGSINARIVIFLALGLIAFIVIGRIVMDRRLAEVRAARSGARARGGARVDFRAAAVDAAERGRYDEAAHLLHAAVIDALTRGGAVKWHPSRTNGDYARDLRRRGSPLAAAFRAFVSDFERVVFGMRGVTREDYLRLRRAAEQIAEPRAAA